MTTTLVKSNSLVGRNRRLDVGMNEFIEPGLLLGTAVRKFRKHLQTWQVAIRVPREELCIIHHS